MNHRATGPPVPDRTGEEAAYEEASVRALSCKRKGPAYMDAVGRE